MRLRLLPRAPSIVRCGPVDPMPPRRIGKCRLPARDGQSASCGAMPDLHGRPCATTAGHDPRHPGPNVDDVVGGTTCASWSGSITCRSIARPETLSGGEAQRIRLASQIGSGLTGVMYVLDEPSIGLHQRDNDRLLATLKHLRDLGNSVIVVEHDHDAIMTADYVVDMGPGAGEHGGQVVAQGTPEEIRARAALADRPVSRRAIGRFRYRRGGTRSTRADADDHRRVGQQSARRHAATAGGVVRLRDRRVGLRQVDADQRHALPRRVAPPYGSAASTSSIAPVDRRWPATLMMSSVRAHHVDVAVLVDDSRRRRSRRSPGTGRDRIRGSARRAFHKRRQRTRAAAAACRRARRSRPAPRCGPRRSSTRTSQPGTGLVGEPCLTGSGSMPIAVGGDRPAGLGLPPVIDHRHLQRRFGPAQRVRVGALAGKEQGAEARQVVAWRCACPRGPRA